jgi:hypothetical protein
MHGLLLLCAPTPQPVSMQGSVVDMLLSSRFSAPALACLRYLTLYTPVAMQGTPGRHGKRLKCELFCHDLTAAAASGSIDPVRSWLPRDELTGTFVG